MRAARVDELFENADLDDASLLTTEMIAKYLMIAKYISLKKTSTKILSQKLYHHKDEISLAVPSRLMSCGLSLYFEVYSQTTVKIVRRRKRSLSLNFNSTATETAKWLTLTFSKQKKAETLRIHQNERARANKASYLLQS